MTKKTSVFFKMVTVIMLAATMIVSSSNYIYADIIDIEMYDDVDFTWRSAPEPIILNDDIDSITLTATCEDGATDNLSFFIVDITHNGAYSSILPFVADGTYTTIARGLAAGKYRVYFVGDADIVKTYAAAVFTVVEE